MKILLTGITGFLGSHLAAELTRHGHEVLGLKRRHSNISRLMEIIDQIQFLDIDSGLAAVIENHRDVDLIIHTATAYGHNQEAACDIVAANVIMPLQLLEWAVGRGTCAFINTDTFFCKASDGYAHLSSYTASKQFFLQLGTQLAKVRDATFCNMRIEHMFGPRDGQQKFTTNIVRQLLEDTPEIRLTPGQQVRDFVFVDDVVNAYMYVVGALASNSLKGVKSYEIGSGVPHTVEEFVMMAHRITGSRSRLSFGGLHYRENEIMHSQANLDALMALGWSPKVNLEAGIEALVRSLRQFANPSHLVTQSIV